MTAAWTPATRPGSAESVKRTASAATLLVIGDSPVVTLEMATELRSVNPRVRIEQIQDAGHALPFEQPDRLAEVVASFLREVA